MGVGLWMWSEFICICVGFVYVGMSGVCDGNYVCCLFGYEVQFSFIIVCEVVFVIIYMARLIGRGHFVFLGISCNLSGHWFLGVVGGTLGVSICL